MRPARRFQVLEYLTLALACACLAFAEGPFFAVRGFTLGPAALLVPVAIMLAIAWWMDGRWALPTWGANVVALLILAADVTWIALLWTDTNSWFYFAPMPAAIVPLVGPLLPALMLVRLFRRRGPADFWLLQAMGVLQVALACVLASGPELGGLLAAYLVCGLGAMAAHYLAVGRSQASGPEGGQAGWGGGFARMAVFVLEWTALVGIAAVAVFLATPRMNISEWEPFKELGGLRSAPRSSSSAVGSIEGVDLNRTGWVDLGNDPAFTFQAASGWPTGAPVTDLPSDMRWRGTILDAYEKGHWLHRFRARPNLGFELPPPPTIPKIGPGQYYLTIHIRPREAGGLFLAEPIYLGPTGTERMPLIALEPPNLLGLFWERAGTVLPGRFRLRGDYRYLQVMAPRRSPQDPAARRTPAGAVESSYLPLMLNNPLPILKPWTSNLLRRLARDGELFRRVASGTPYDLAGVVPRRSEQSQGELLLDPDDWERVARALSDYLAYSKEYTYTLDLQRQRAGLDPILDFLFYTKSGHCERYAAALTLMLRSVGIPARMVKGYKGLEHLGGGNYVVHQSQLHAWVEALVPSRDVPESFDWVTLDPTPEFGTSPAPPFSLGRLWSDGQRGGQFIWDELIVGYNSDNQADLMGLLRTAGLLPGVRAGLLVGGVLAIWGAVVLLRRWRRRHTDPAVIAPAVSFYRRLLELLAQYRGLTPATGQTPREFAQTAATVLGEQTATAGWADVPLHAAELYYRVRFGARSLDEAEDKALATRLDELATALRWTARPATA